MIIAPQQLLLGNQSTKHEVTQLVLILNNLALFTHPAGQHKLSNYKNWNQGFPDLGDLAWECVVSQPVQTVNSRFAIRAPTGPLETSTQGQATPFDTGHLPPRNDVIKETLTWYDGYLGA